MRKVIDLSDWNDDVDWEAVKDAGIGGIVTKIMEGRRSADLWRDHVRNALKSGLDIGFYIYTHAQTTDQATFEANILLSMLPVAPALGIWYDVEAPEVVGQDSDDVTAVCSKFISTCNGAGYEAGIYANLSTLTDKIQVESLAAYVPYWCAQYFYQCNFKDRYPDHILRGWQFTDKMEIGGKLYDCSYWYD